MVKSLHPGKYTVCVEGESSFLTVEIQDNTFVIEPNLMKFFCDKVVCVPLIPLQKKRLAEINGMQDCHDIHVLHKCM